MVSILSAQGKAGAHRRSARTARNLRARLFASRGQAASRAPVRFAIVLLAALLPLVAASATSVHAPDWSLEDVDGHSVDFRAEPGGRPAIVLFWATWCPYCRKLMPHLDSIQRDYRARGVEIYALNIWEDGDAVAYFAQHGYSMRLLLAADLVAEDYAVAWTPAVLLVDGAHDVLYARQRGETPEFVATAIREQLERALSDLE